MQGLRAQYLPSIHRHRRIVYEVALPQKLGSLLGLVEKFLDEEIGVESQCVVGSAAKVVSYCEIGVFCEESFHNPHIVRLDGHINRESVHSAQVDIEAGLSSE